MSTHHTGMSRTSAPRTAVQYAYRLRPRRPATAALLFGNAGATYAGCAAAYEYVPYRHANVRVRLLAYTSAGRIQYAYRLRPRRPATTALCLGAPCAACAGCAAAYKYVPYRHVSMRMRRLAYTSAGRICTICLPPVAAAATRSCDRRDMHDLYDQLGHGTIRIPSTTTLLSATLPGAPTRLGASISSGPRGLRDRPHYRT